MTDVASDRFRLGDAEQSALTPVAGRLQRLLPHASVTSLDGCGHFTPIECPDRPAGAMVRSATGVAA